MPPPVVMFSHWDAVELVSSLCAQLCSVSDSTAQPYALRFPTTTPRPTMLQSGRSHYNQVGRTTIRSVTLQLGRSHYNRVSHATIGSVVLLSGLSGVLSLPAFVPLLCMLFPTTPCKGLTFTYMLPYLAPVVAALGTHP